VGKDKTVQLLRSLPYSLYTPWCAVLDDVCYCVTCEEARDSPCGWILSLRVFPLLRRAVQTRALGISVPGYCWHSLCACGRPKAGSLLLCVSTVDRLSFFELDPRTLAGRERGFIPGTKDSAAVWLWGGRRRRERLRPLALAAPARLAGGRNGENMCVLIGQLGVVRDANSPKKLCSRDGPGVAVESEGQRRGAIVPWREVARLNTCVALEVRKKKRLGPWGEAMSEGEQEGEQEGEAAGEGTLSASTDSPDNERTSAHGSPALSGSLGPSEGRVGVPHSPGHRTALMTRSPLALVAQRFFPPLYNPSGVCPMVWVNPAMVCIHKHMSSEFYLLNTQKWTITPTSPAPIALYGTSLVSCGGRYVLAVGGQSTVYLNVIMLLDLFLDEWTLMVGCPFPPAKYVSAIIIDSRFLLVFGGYGDYYSNEMWVYDMLARRWSGVDFSRAGSFRMYAPRTKSESSRIEPARCTQEHSEVGEGKCRTQLALAWQREGEPDSGSRSHSECMQSICSQTTHTPLIPQSVTTCRQLAPCQRVRVQDPDSSSRTRLIAASAPVLCLADSWLYIFGGRGYSLVFRIHVTELAGCCLEPSVGRSLLWYFYRERYSHAIALAGS